MRGYTGCLLLALMLVSSAGWAQRLSEADRARIEALYEEGMGLLKGEDGEAAEARFRAALELDARHAPSLVGLGQVHLTQGDLNAAEQAFMEARRRKHTYAPVYYGLGLVWRERPNGLNTAIGYFRQALQYDRNYLEARYQIALARYAMKEPDVKREAERLIAMDASFAPAYLLLGTWYEEYAGNDAEAERYYRQYLSLEPGDVAVLLRLARVYQGRGEPEQVVALLREVAEAIAALPVLAVAYMELDSLSRAEAVFGEYLAGCASEERALYEDIRLLSSSEEYRAYQETPDREAFLSRFWGDRDPNVTTSVNERMLEHYRRVWYARTHFSQRQQPWDARGEVYVRFGEPDHRSKSNWQNFQQSLAVQRVKENLAGQLGYGGTKIFLVSFPVRSKRDNPDRYKLTFDPVTSEEDISMVPWESWVYTSVGAGMEVTFTDEFQSGKFDYAPPPLSADYDLRQLAMFNRLSPRNVTMLAAAQTPNYYQPPANEDPFPFYFDLADFRGQNASALEVYTGIPQEMAQYLEAEDATYLEVERTVGLLHLETGEAYRATDAVRFRQTGDVRSAIGAFVPDVARLELPPGPYRMEVKVVDAHTGRHGRYRQMVEVDAYPEEGLRMSDLALSWRIEEDTGGGKFNKGGLEVVPMPTRTYGKDQRVYVYYEIYNLARDAFGQTRYEVSYTMGQQDGFSVGSIARLMRLRGDRREEVAVASEQRGTSATEVAYVGLELGDYKEGRQVLRVEVRDMNSGEIVQKEAVFVVK